MLKCLIRGHSKIKYLESPLITADSNFKTLPLRVLKVDFNESGFSLCAVHGN